MEMVGVEGTNWRVRSRRESMSKKVGIGEFGRGEGVDGFTCRDVIGIC